MFLTTFRAQSGIIVVHEDPQARAITEEDEELQMLKRLPSVTPILKVAPNFNWSDLFASIGGARMSHDSVDAAPLLAFAQRYQHHLRSSAKSVVHDQGLLSTNIRRVETFAAKIVVSLSQKVAQAHYYHEQLKGSTSLPLLLTFNHFADF